jgi:hypothetical protein
MHRRSYPDLKGKNFFNSIKSGRLDYLDYIECQPTHFTIVPEFYNISRKNELVIIILYQRMYYYIS